MIDDIMSRLSSIFDDADHDGELDGGETIYASYKYLGSGRIVVEDYEDVEVKLDYTDNDFAALDRFGRVLDQVWSDYGETETIDRYTYTYDRAGNRTAKDNELHAAFDEDYTYDDLDRLLTSERADDYDQSWTLDGQGNFRTFDDDGTSQNRTTNEANEIESITGGWKSPEYDAAGNLIYGPKSGDETTGLHFVRDAWNRQVAVYTDDGDGVFEPSTDDTLIGEYEFDGVNRRIEKILSSTHAHYYYNQNWQMLEERFVDGQGDPIEINQHVFSPDYIDSPIVWRHDANGDGDYADQGDLLRYYLSDANHNTTAVFDQDTGEVVKRYVYTAYGSHAVYDPDWTNPTAPTADGIMYSGYWLDIETGNYQVRAREYITCLSTFDVRDPIGYEGGINLYCYCGNDPVVNTDPEGLTGWQRMPKTPPKFPGGRNSPGYEFWVYWVVPKPKPANAQVWQVTMFNTLTVSASPDCHLTVETSFKMDVNNIGANEEIIPDQIASKGRPGKVCLMLQTSIHYIGFGGIVRLPEMSSMNISATDAWNFITFMRPPTSVYMDVYLFVNKENCKCCPFLSETMTFAGIPDCNLLYTDITGKWPKLK